MIMFFVIQIGKTVAKQGRPKIKDERFRRVLQTIRLPRFVVEWLDHQKESSGEVVEKALIEHYQISPDEEKKT